MHKFIYLLFSIILFSHNIYAQPSHVYSPADIDPMLTSFNTDSVYVYQPNIQTAKYQLLVFLPGTGAKAEDYQLFGQKAADEGYHVIILTYSNSPTIHSLCKDSSDSDCYEDTRLEVIDGIDQTTNVDIDEHHSILGRLKRTLNHIYQEFPFENFDLYYDLNNSELKWEDIAWAGHSQGGGHAALIGQKYLSSRIICFASPKDYSNYFNAPANWYINDWMTPEYDIWALGHTFDGYNRQVQIWDNMNLNFWTGPRVIENTNFPYDDSHELFTNYPIGIIASHSVMIWDGLVPIINGVNYYDEAWDYLLNSHIPVDINNIPEDNDIIISPNPFINGLTIDSKSATLNRIFIYDYFGKTVYQSNKDLTAKIDLSFLNSGTYYLKSVTDESIQISKIIKHSK